LLNITCIEKGGCASHISSHKSRRLALRHASGRKLLR
jgi:hypothetical protein